MVDDNARDIVIFVHIPKTAGTTFNSILSMQYGHRRSLWVDRLKIEETRIELASKEESDRERLKLLRGHIPFGWHEMFIQPSSYIAFMRDPVRRVVSHYLADKKLPEGHPGSSRGKSLRSVVESCNYPYANNDQVRRLSGKKGDDTIGEADLEEAKRNIENEFCVVGLTERFDESLALMARALSWRRPVVYIRSKVGQKSADPLCSFDDATVDAVESHNEYDIRLYEYCRDRFDGQIETCRAWVANEVERIRRRNLLMQKIGVVPLKAYRAGRRLLGGI